jgi:hypothetical protein
VVAVRAIMGQGRFAVQPPTTEKRQGADRPTAREIKD